jgi:hypothetical protein
VSVREASLDESGSDAFGEVEFLYRG